MQLPQAEYLALTTYKRSGQAVSTAMWFGLRGDRLYMQTNIASAKIKRIRNAQTPNGAPILLAPSDVRGNPLGEAVNGRAFIHPPDSPIAQIALDTLKEHYGLKFRLFNLGLRLFRRQLAYIEVHL